MRSLQLTDFTRKLTHLLQENIKQIIVHLGENYRDRMKEITYVDTFNMLILRCEQLQDTTMPSSYVQEDKSIRYTLQIPELEMSYPGQLGPGNSA